MLLRQNRPLAERFVIPTETQRSLFPAPGGRVTDQGGAVAPPKVSVVTIKGKAIIPAPCCVPASPFGEHKAEARRPKPDARALPCTHCGASNWRSYTTADLQGGKLVDIPTVYCAECGEKRT